MPPCGSRLSVRLGDVEAEAAFVAVVEHQRSRADPIDLERLDAFPELPNAQLVDNRFDDVCGSQRRGRSLA